jgi:hypothetical protein
MDDTERKLTVDERLERVRKLRERLPGGGISSDEILWVIRQGRERYGHFVNGEVAKHPPNAANNSFEADLI